MATAAKVIKCKAAMAWEAGKAKNSLGRGLAAVLLKPRPDAHHVLQHQSQSAGSNYPKLPPPLRFLPREAAMTAPPVFSARSDAARSNPPPASASTDDSARRRPPPMESAFDGLNAVPSALELRAKDSTVESNLPPPSASTDDRARRRPPPMQSAFDGLDATPREGTAVPAALELPAKDSTVELVLDAGVTGGVAGQQRAGEGEGGLGELPAEVPRRYVVCSGMDATPHGFDGMEATPCGFDGIDATPRGFDGFDASDTPPLIPLSSLTRPPSRSPVMETMMLSPFENCTQQSTPLPVSTQSMPLHPTSENGVPALDSTMPILVDSTTSLSPTEVDDKNGESIHVPEVGMNFKSEKDAYDFYNCYAGKIGFSVRKSHSRLRQDGSASLAGLKGSIGYIAPEYGMGGNISTEGDVHSFSILLLEMLTGKRPTDEIFKNGMVALVSIRCIS